MFRKQISELVRKIAFSYRIPLRLLLVCLLLAVLLCWSFDSAATMADLLPTWLLNQPVRIANTSNTWSLGASSHYIQQQVHQIHASTILLCIWYSLLEVTAKIWFLEEFISCKPTRKQRQYSSIADYEWTIYLKKRWSFDDEKSYLVKHCEVQRGLLESTR